MVVAVLALPSIDAIAKFLSTTDPAGQVAWTRFLIQAILIAPFVLGSADRERSIQVAAQALRGVLIVTTTVLMFTAVKYMPMADAIAIFFVELLVVALLSAMFLGERVGWRRIAAALVGFLGALLVVRPSYELFGLTAVLPLFVAFCFAFYMVLTRRLAQSQPVSVLHFNVGVAVFVFLGAMLVIGHIVEIPIFQPVWPTFFEWSLLALAGLIATAGHLMIVMAFRHLEASALAPFQHLEIVAATGFGLWLFGDFPDSITWLGISIIVGSGLYIFHCERLRARNQ